MDPHLMLFSSCPCSFESAFAADMEGAQGADLLMALVGVLLASLLTEQLLGLEPTWEFNVCRLIGTTPPTVAVVALLKELGTDKAIGTLIEGESLLNDGSVVVLYVVLKN